MAKTASLFMPVLQFFDDDGIILAGGTLTFYEAGTSTLKDTWADEDKVTTNPNPITLDSAGRPDNSGSPIQIWLDGAYKIVLKDSAGNTLRTEDNITGLAEATGYETKSANYTILETDYAKLFNVSTSGGAVTITLPVAADVGSGFWVSVAKSTNDSDLVTIDGNGSETINGQATFSLGTQYEIVTLFCTGTAWIIKDKSYQTSGYKEITTNYTVVVTDDNVLIDVDTTSADITVTLFSVTAAAAGFIVGISKETSDVNTVIIDADGSEEIDGETTLTLYNQYDTVYLLNNGTSWTIINRVFASVSEDADSINTTKDLNITVSDSRTNSIDYPLTITSTTSGTPAAGIGTGLIVQAESADEDPSNLGALAFIATDVTSGSEDTDFVIQTRSAGGAIANSYKFRTTDDSGNYIITGAPTAERTITLADADIDLSSTGMVLLETQTASNTAQITFDNLDSTYIRHVIVLYNVLVGTDTTSLYLRLSSNNGSSYITSNYYYAGWVMTSAPATANASAAAAGQFSLVTNCSNVAGQTMNGTINLTGIGTATQTVMDATLYGIDEANAAKMQHMGGISIGSASTNAVAVFPSSGVIASGTFKLYGIKA